MLKRAILLGLVICVALSGAFGGDEEERGVARDILAKYQDAVVFVKAVGKVDFSAMGGPSNDRKIETTGIVIDPSGLTVISLFSFDPMGSMGGMGGMFGRGDSGIKTDFSEVKLLLADGTEVPSKLVLKDPDLDLAFILPEKKEGEDLPKFTSIPLKKAPEVGLLDPVFTLDRLGKSLDRQPAIFMARISAIVKKPRKVFITSGGGRSISSPVFTSNGEILGINLMRKPAQADAGMSPIVLPAEEVMDIAQQALKRSAKE
jgi:hypothetical protein